MPRPADGGNVLGAARLALFRTYAFGAMWRLTRNATFAARGVAEVLSFTTQWDNWQPIANALVMGELSHAAAIGLDWLYDAMDGDSRAAIIAGLVERSATPFAAAYVGGDSADWWLCASTNWDCVCNSGAGISALALLGEAGAPSWTGDLLANATRSVKCSAAAPAALGTGGGLFDGAWWESPMYSGYVLRYHLPFATALAAVTGDASAFVPGLSDAPLFQVASMDAQWRYHNTGDALESQETLSMLLALAGQSGGADGRGAAFALRARLDANPVPADATDIANCSSCSMEYINALLFFSDAGDAAARDALPLDVVYPSKKLALMRSSWAADGTFVGFKAGANCSWFHNDLDAGSFSYSSGGVRWASELGSDNYGLPGYFGRDRFQWYRKNSRGHNTLQFNNTVHDGASCVGSDLERAPATWLSAFATAAPASARVFPAPAAHPLSACALQPGDAVCAVANLTGAFSAQGVAAATRTLSLDAASRSVLTVSDRWVLDAGAAAPPSATAAIHTFVTNVTLAADGRSALLRQDGLAVAVRVGAASPCPAAAVTWAVVAVRLAPPQDPTEGLSRVDITVDPRACAGLDVVIGPA